MDTSRRATSMLGIAALLTTLSACSGSDSTPLAIAPQSPELAFGETLQFSAAAPGGPVSWAVLESNGGTIDEGGLYTAPAMEGTYTVEASSGSLANTTQVRVKRASVTVSPSTATLSSGDTLALSAQVTGSVKTVTWTVAEGAAGGTVTTAGLYTAPQATGTFQVVATSTADPTKSDHAIITVIAPPPPPPPAIVAIAIAPQAASVVASGTVQFGATVTGSSDVGVSWSVGGSGSGTVTAAGLYTAPATAGTYDVIAASTADPSKTSGAKVTVTAPTPPAGTGGSHGPQYVSVSGAGAMPSTAGAPVASCAGNGTTDDTACLQGAIDAARAAGKPLVIPTPAAYYRISAPLKVKTSLLGTGGMPTIKTTSSGSGYDEQGAILQIVASNVHVYNLRLVGTYAASGAPQSAGPNISLGNVSNVTIRGNRLEAAQGDSISDHYQEMDGGSGGVANVLVQGNTLLRPGRCCVSLVALVARWAILDNVCVKEGPTSDSPFDWEPWQSASFLSDIELAYNDVTFWSGASPESPPLNVNGWFDTTPGGNIYTHHNFGSWPNNNYGQFVGKNGNWTNVVIGPNVKGSSPPVP
jgi:hypothetical protein